jgi:hypothetical protein
MKKSLMISSVIFSVFVLIAIVWAVLDSQAPEQVYSPDGSKVMIPMVNSNKDNYDSYLLVYLEIKDTQSGETLFQVQTRASDRMRWSVDWIDDNTVKLNSSDIGSYCWMEGDNGIWAEIQCP